MDPEHPPTGEDHILQAPAIPAPIPIDGTRLARASLVVSPAGLSVTPDFRNWVRRFVRTRFATATGKAMKPTIDLAVDAEAEVRAALALESAKPVPMMRGMWRPRTAEQRQLIAATHVDARDATRQFFTNYHLHRDDTVDGVSFLITGAYLSGDIGPRAPQPLIDLTADAYARLVLNQYDEIIFAVPKGTRRTLVNRWKRYARGWIVEFGG